MAITPLPSPPQPTDTTAQFNSKAFAWVAALGTFVTEANATEAAVDADAATATTKAAEASASASAAATSESNAATSAAAATNAKNEAESARDATLAAFDSFDDRYLGSKTADPTVDNDGNPLVAGALYFNSVAGVMKVYTGSAWVAAYVSPDGLLPLAGGTMTGAITFAAGQTFPGTGDVTLTGTQTLTNKTIAFASNTLTDVASTNTAQTLTNKTIAFANNTLTGVQPSLVSGTNIKTINGSSVLGSGDLAVGGGAMILLGQINANAASTVDLNGFFSSTYDQYEIIASNVTFSTGQQLRAYVRVGGVYQTSSYFYRSSAYNPTAARQANSFIIFMDQAVNAGDIFSFNFKLSRPSFVERKAIFGSYTLHGLGSEPYHSATVGIWGGSTAAWDGIQFFSNTGTITGDFRVYGIKKS